MPQVVITFNTRRSQYEVEEYRPGMHVDENHAVAYMKNSHLVSLRRRQKKYEMDQETLSGLAAGYYMRGLHSADELQ